MERKITKLLVSTGVVTALAVSMIPLTSYAAVSSIYNCGQDGTEACASSDSTSQVSVTVNDILTLDATKTGMETTGEHVVNGVIQAYPGLTRTGKLNVNVRSAKAYTISLSAEEPNLIYNDNDSIMIRARNDIEAQDKSGWGIKKINSDGSNATKFSAITTAPVEFFTGQPTDLVAGHDENNFVITAFEVGVKAGPEIPQGTYQTDVTVLAAVKE